MTDERRAEGDDMDWLPLFSRVADPLCVTDSTGLIVRVNAAFERCLGWRDAELQAASINGLVHPDDRPRAKDVARTIARKGAISGFEARFRARDGSYRWLRWCVTADASRQVGIAHDVTDEKARSADLMAQLQRSQKLEGLGRLAGDVAHDFNNLLTVILGNSELLSLDLAANASASALLHDVTVAAERAARITAQLLAFARRQIAEPRVHDINGLVRGIEPVVRQMLGDEVALATVFGTDVGSIKIDAVQFEQVIVNLVANARDAMPSGGKLVIETEQSSLGAHPENPRPELDAGDFAVLRVTDTGAGMPADVRQRAFEPFFTTKRASESAGLGLATAHAIVRQSGGDIALDSAPGRGTTVKIWWPRADAMPEGAPERAVEARSEGRETILVVEDENLVRRIAVRALADRGYTVLAAATAEEALRMAHEQPGTIDLLLTDVVLPGLSGPRLAERLLTQRPELIVMFTSGFTDQHVAATDLDDDRVHFLGKPYTPARLADAIRTVLSGFLRGRALHPD